MGSLDVDRDLWRVFWLGLSLYPQHSSQECGWCWIRIGAHKEESHPFPSWMLLSCNWPASLYCSQGTGVTTL